MSRLVLILLFVSSSGTVFADGRFDMGEIVDSVAEALRPETPTGARAAADATVASLINGVEKCLSDPSSAKAAPALNACLQGRLAGFASYLVKERFPNQNIRICTSN